jgi:hypothetical protein
MKKENSAPTNSRVEAFVERVNETEPLDVVEEFMRRFKQCTDPVHVNLAIMLNESRKNSRGAKERFLREQSSMDSASLPICCFA